MAGADTVCSATGEEYESTSGHVSSSHKTFVCAERPNCTDIVDESEELRKSL
jgi:hypothetical protein